MIEYDRMFKNTPIVVSWLKCSRRLFIYNVDGEIPKKYRKYRNYNENIENTENIENIENIENKDNIDKIDR